MEENNNIRIQLRAIKKLLKLVDKNRQPVAKNLFERLQFMAETLCVLEEKIQKEGAIIEMVNGNGFKTVAENPAQKSYNTMIGRYNAVMKTFIDILPEAAQDTDEFTKFVRGSK